MFLLNDDQWEVKETKEKGLGVFATKKIKAGTIIGDYLGKVIRTAEYDLENDKNGLYLMYLTDNASIYPDLTKPGVHLLNHSCVPNCWISLYRGHTLFFALRDITPNEELSLSYLLSPKDEYCAPCLHDCKCGETQCVGTMHLPKDKYEAWQEFQNEEKKKTKTARFVYGKLLPKFISYPDIDFTNPIYKKMSSQTNL
jgi:SET domain-containing protein